MQKVAGSNPVGSTKLLQKMKYDFANIEKEIQAYWEKEKIFKSSISNKPKYYVLDMFPYPSGDGLHVGHVKGYSASDSIAHYKRLCGFNVIHPMGWDAFGLPAENYAIKMKKNPKEVVEKNIINFTRQLKSMGFSYDWSREINTTEPSYYKWTQWIFLKLFNKGLAYEQELPINFCPSCKTGLANEEVISGTCERCHSKVERKKIRQWVLKITEYADRLLEDLEDLDWPEPIKEMQRNWIGKSQGTNVDFKIRNSETKIQVYTTRVDTLFGVTYLVVAPENELIARLKDNITNYEEVEKYMLVTQNKSDLERIELKEKTGIELKGIKAIHPLTGEEIPVWTADYVLSGYGTGAVMAVPAHDERDMEFSQKFSLAVINVIRSAENPDENSSQTSKAFTDYGILENSGEFDGLTSDEAKEKITNKLKSINLGDLKINYKLRDWIFSRQRYWGEPIPIIHCKDCGTIGVEEKDLPLELPYVESYEPSGTGESPLENINEWVNTTCPKCGGPAKRETNTMPQWAGSCWYYLRFADPHNPDELISKEADEYYLPVDFYVGGAEHAVLHLLYARFWHKFLFDVGVVKDSEPFKKLKNVGLILAPDNTKMSKSKGNVINPDDVVAKFGADALRMYELFIGPFDQPAAWNPGGIVGTKKFLDKVASCFDPKELDNNADIDSLILSITNKLENNLYNTAVSDFMKFSNDYDLNSMSKEQWKTFLILLTPFAPHLSEYLMIKISGDSVFTYSWPNAKITNRSITYTIQVNGKRRGSIDLEVDEGEENLTQKAKSIKTVKNAIGEKEIKKTIFIKNKVINFVI